jgi:tetratricopeptide (TPR) repeat protein
VAPRQGTPVATARPVSPAVYELYLKGRFHWHKQSPADLNTALEYFEAALQRDSSYALACAGIADVWLARGDRGFVPPHEAFRKATAAASQALELDSSLAEAHYSQATLLSVQWDWPAAERGYRRVLELNPNHLETHLSYAHLLVGLRRFRDWQPVIERTLTLDPLNFVVPCFYGSHLVCAGQLDQGIAQLRRTLAMQPAFSGAHLNLWTAFFKKEMLDEALLQGRDFFAAINDRECAELLESGLESGSYAQRMRAVADKLAVRSERLHVPSIRIARVYSHAGETDRALEWLERAYERRESPLGHLAAGPEWDGLRADSRFIDLLLRLKLPTKTGAH